MSSLPHLNMFGESIPGKNAKRLRTLPWRGVPPSYPMERSAGVADLEAILNDPTIDFGQLCHYIATSLYVCSGSELERVLRGLIVLLREEHK
jgi:hypothetical protein